MATLADTLTPIAWRRTRAARITTDATLIVAGSLVVAASAYLRVDLWFTPVPITGQTFAVLLVGAALGPRRGAASLSAYLVEGAAGLPVFAGGMAGLAVLFGPTGGYLWSYPLAAGVVGMLSGRRWDRRPATTLLAMAAGNAVVYLVGLPWLAFFVGPSRVLAAGLLPFVPGDLLKLLLAAAALPTAWKIVSGVRGG